MRSRILPLEEWPRLQGTEAETIYPQLNPAHGHFLVVEDDGAIVGCLLVMTVVHVECAWIAPSHRKRASVGRRLLAALHQDAATLQVRAVVGAAQSDEMRLILGHLGATALPAAFYMLPMKES